MEQADFEEAVLSMITRYENILGLSKQLKDINDRHIHTLVEDSFEYARDLAIEFCEKREPTPFQSCTRHPMG